MQSSMKTTTRIRKRELKKSMVELQSKAEEKLKFEVINTPLFGHFENEEEKLGLESAYITKFNEIGKLTEQKNIKFFSAIGDPKITTDEVEEIENERTDFQEEYLENLRYEGVHRYELKTNSD